jgi:hypothetical protein
MNVNDPWPPKTDEIVRVLARNPNTWMTPEEIRQGLGLPGGCRNTHQLRPTLSKLVENNGLVKSIRPNGFKYKLTSKGERCAKEL